MSVDLDLSTSRSRSYVIVHGHGMKNAPFSATDAVDWLKSESEVGKASYGAMQAVTTLCRFHCGASEVRVLTSAVAVSLSSGAQVVGVNSSDSFLDSNIMRLYRRVNVFLLQSTSSFDERVFQNSYTVIPGFDARLSNRPFLVFDFRSFGRQSAWNLEKN